MSYPCLMFQYSDSSTTTFDWHQIQTSHRPSPGPDPVPRFVPSVTSHLCLSARPVLSPLGLCVVLSCSWLECSSSVGHSSRGHESYSPSFVSNVWGMKAAYDICLFLKEGVLNRSVASIDSGSWNWPGTTALGLCDREGAWLGFTQTWLPHSWKPLFS